MPSRRLVETGPPPPPERSFWQLLPRRNFRRALFLVIVLLGVIALKHSGKLSLKGLFDPPPQSQTQTPAPPGEFQHLEVKR